MNAISANLNKHLADLLLFSARAGVAIRLNSTFGDALNPSDITWVSETLTKFGPLARAVRAGDLESVRCEAGRISMEFKTFKSGEAKPILGSRSLSTFQDLSDRGILNLDWAITALDNLQKEADL